MNLIHATRHPLLAAGISALTVLTLLATGCGKSADEGDSSGADTTAALDSPEAQAFQAEVAGRIQAAQGQLDAILAVDGPRTIENTLVPMNEISIQLDAAGAKSSLFENVHPDPAVRAAAEKGSQEVSNFVTQLSLNRDVYDAIVAVDVSGADPLTQRYDEKLLRDYRRAGVDKDEATREKIQALKDELVLVGQEFDRNIRDDVRHIELNGPEDLEGLPQDYIDAHQPGENGKIEINTQYPDYIPFMTYAKNGEARKELYLAFLNRAYPQNEEVLKNLMAKRQELAELLGYPSWAAYVTEDKMAKNPERVQEFIQQLDTAAKERGRKDYALLLARKQKDYPEATTVNDWEKAYYGELVKSEEYDFDSQELREYYDFPRVKDGILNVTEQLFSVEYKKVQDPDVWDPSVEAYDVYDGGNRIGRFYLDLHPRDGKYNHAAQFTLQTGVKDRQIPIGVLVCNFPGGGNGPALMEQDDVETFFHEFGHLLHHIFGGNQPWVDMSGVATEWDFVEAPSQLLEEWATDTTTLQTFARHYQTGEPIPAELVERLRAAKQFGNGTYVTQQNFYTAISLDIYNEDPSTVDLDQETQNLQKEYGMFAYVPGAHMYASFGHLEGYSAMYYTYMWSLVIAKDLFSQFDRENMLDPVVATRYRKIVLDQGGTKDADELVQEFLGRPYGFDSFRVWLNQDS